MTARIDLTAEQFRELARSIWDEAVFASDVCRQTSQELWDQSASKVTVENLLAVEATPGGEG